MDIFELFDGTCPENIPLDESPIDTERVLARVRAGVRGTARRPRRFGRTVRIALSAAALALAMSVTAYAVYLAQIEDYVIEQPLTPPPAAETADAAVAEDAEMSTQRLSLVGYQGTPEYEAFTEWEAWNDQWHEENSDRWAEMGVDDAWHETPDNYILYNAVFQDQADKLDAIAAEHGLTLHTQWAWYKTVDELYEALDVGTLGLVGGSGYVYDDGSFKLECSSLPGVEGVEVGAFVSVKGSFSMISGGVRTDYEEWGYETADGTMLDLVLDKTGGIILYETPGAYIHVSASRAIEHEDGTWENTLTKEELEAVAEGVGFGALAERFDGRKDESITAAVAALAEKRRQEEQEQQAAAEEASANMQDILEDLGRYAPRMLPAQVADMLHAGEYAADEMIGLDGTAQYAGGAFFPDAEQADLFTYYRIKDSSTPAGEYIAAIRDWLTGKYPDGEITDETVQGRDAVMVLMPDHGAVYWYDAEADLIFNMSVDSVNADPAVDRAAVLALAESVEKVG